ncbi:hypothetical protein M436DRAFT_68223 [Aureobasidium namibiae CBS 147.97]|uniref:Protein kinase domain-containing protein n=1 Tax=Aureobasidium namibiae CBS 147.97 TaxID=1043004 RepID=A0A074W5E8_9PEZI|nr:uncharacterized protein M436DRAFT_68223 [Aureobasidium namibiae CBS 147.97]KEQ68360.1 hypothetical protein M436DRAFT_68223 [Aureobasidium namibiae CBS 147.97]
MNSMTDPAGCSVGEVAQDVDATPYCSHDCLLQASHPECSHASICPNSAAHDGHTLASDSLVNLLEDQLRSSRPNDTGLTPLGKSGRLGILYKVHLHKTGHRLVAKGFRKTDLQWLLREESVYDRLQRYQGTSIPVYCGTIYLDKSINQPAVDEIHYLLLLSWAGEALEDTDIDHEDLIAVDAMVEPQLLSLLRGMHELQVVHGDTVRRNYLYDANAQRFMLVDFELSRLYNNRPPCNTGLSCQKTRRDNKGRQKPCMYCGEKLKAVEELHFRFPSTKDAAQSEEIYECNSQVESCRKQRTHHMGLRRRIADK